MESLRSESRAPADHPFQMSFASRASVRPRTASAKTAEYRCRSVVTTLEGKFSATNHETAHDPANKSANLFTPLISLRRTVPNPFASIARLDPIYFIIYVSLFAGIHGCKYRVH